MKRKYLNRCLSSLFALCFMAQVLLLPACSKAESDQNATAESADDTVFTEEEIDTDPETTLTAAVEESEIVVDDSGNINSADISSEYVSETEGDNASTSANVFVGTRDPEFIICGHEPIDQKSATNIDLGIMDFTGSRYSEASNFVSDDGYFYVQQAAWSDDGKMQFTVIDIANGDIVGQLPIPLDRSQYGMDAFVFEKEGVTYMETDVYDPEGTVSDIVYYVVDTDTFTVGAEAEPFNGEDLCIVSQCKMPDGDCFIVRDQNSYGEPLIYIYQDGEEEADRVVDMRSLCGAEDVGLSFLGYYADSSIVVRIYDMEGMEISFILNYGDKADEEGLISSHFPPDLYGANGLIANSQNNLYIANANGIVKIDPDDRYFSEIILNYADVNDDCNVTLWANPVCVDDDGSVVMITYEYEENLGEHHLVYTRISAEADVEDPRRPVNLLVYGYPDAAITTSVSAFNQSNSDYRVRMLILDSYVSEGVALDQADASFSSDFSVEYNNPYSTSEMLLGYLDSVLCEPDMIDIFISDGAQPELQATGSFLDMTDYIDHFNDEHPGELYENIIDCARLYGGLYQIPYKFYFTGIASMSDITSETLSDNNIDGELIEGVINIVETDYENYQKLSSSVWGFDIYAAGCAPMDYFDDLVSIEYQRLIQMDDNGHISLDEDSLSKVAEYISTYGCAPDYSDQNVRATLMSIQSSMDFLWVFDMSYLIKSFVPLPSINMEDASVNVTPYMSFGIASGCSETEGAYAFLDCMLSNRNNGEYEFCLNREASAQAVEEMVDRRLATREELDLALAATEQLINAAGNMTYVDSHLRSTYYNIGSPDEVDPAMYAEQICSDYNN